MKHLRIFSNKGTRGREQNRGNQQGPCPRFQDLQRDRDTNLHVKEGWCVEGGGDGGGRLEAAAVRVSLSITSQDARLRKTHSGRVAWFCGEATIHLPRARMETPRKTAS